MDSGFVIRGAGAGAACLVADRRWRAAVLAGSYVALVAWLDARTIARVKAKLDAAGAAT